MKVSSSEHGLQIWGGLECTINRVGDNYFDQLANADFYNKPVVNEIADLGIKRLRFPILWEKHQPTLDEPIDWSWTETQLASFQQKGIDVIAGLVHHGSGPSFTNLLDDQFPYLLANYAKEVAFRFPHIKYYTPVNEPLTTARFSGLYGLWYPHQKSDEGFLRMLLIQLKAIVLSMQEIRKINPEAQLVQTEDLGKTYSTPALRYQANLENTRRWLTYDLLCGKLDRSHLLWSYFKQYDIGDEELEFFINNPCVPDVFGFNHYVTSERFLDEKLSLYPPHTHGGNEIQSYADVEAARVSVNEETGVKLLLKEAWERYGRPMALTEVHLHCHREEQLRWFQYILNACTELKQTGVDLIAVTSWALLGSFGWNKLLTMPKGEYEPGAFDLRGGKPRATALALFLKAISQKTDANHHLATAAGWWLRNTRLLYRQEGSECLPIEASSRPPVLIIGKRGTLGKAIATACTDRAIPFALLSREDCDITDSASIERAIEQYKPWAIINAAGYVRVDDAEREEESCVAANSFGPANLATACKSHHIQFVTFSSDLVFDGEKQSPYVESDVTNALNVYGRSKEFCENLVAKANSASLVIRTSAFFSPNDEYNFLYWVEQSLLKGSEVAVANDILVSPTYVPDLVHATLDLLIDEENGIWHLANKGTISWADLAYRTASSARLDTTNIKAVPAKNLNFAAPRPHYTVLGTEKGHLLPSLDDALNRYFRDKKFHAALVD